MATMAARHTPDGEPRSITARVLAPLALIACGLALFLLVSQTLSGGDDEPGRDRAPRKEQRAKQEKEPAVKGDTYVVVPGDTFSGIALKAGIPLSRLERLNKGVDPNTLNAGQTLKLKP
jgi:LysM repeat protein